MQKCKIEPHIGYLVFVVQTYVFNTHLLQRQNLYKCVLVHYICLQEKTPSQNNLYCLCISGEYEANMTFALRAKNEQSYANVEITPYLVPYCMWYKCTLSPRIYGVHKDFTNVFFFITFACMTEWQVKVAFTVFAP